MPSPLRPRLPGPESLARRPGLAPLRRWLVQPGLWRLNRRSAAGGVAVGLFCGLIPGPLQMLGAALLALVLRVNLPLALACTLYTNPFTILPLYWLAYRLGRWLVGPGDGTGTPPPAWEGVWNAWSTWSDGFTATLHWALALGRPLLVGLISLALLLAGAGYAIVRAGWRLYLIRAWHRRRQERRPIHRP